MLNNVEKHTGCWHPTTISKPKTTNLFMQVGHITQLKIFYQFIVKRHI